MTALDALVDAVKAGYTVTLSTGTHVDRPLVVEVVGPDGTPVRVTVDADQVPDLDRQLPGVLDAVRRSLPPPPPYRSVKEQ